MDLEKLDAVIKNTSLSLNEARKTAQAMKAEIPFTKAVIQVNPKINGSQRHLQCSLRFHDSFAHLAPEALPEPQMQQQIFGIPVPKAFAPPRDF